MLTEVPTQYVIDRQRKLWDVAFVSPKQAKVANGNECMDSDERLCQYPKDVEACRQSLIRAWREDSLLTHCIFLGLQEGLETCRKALKEGLYDEHRSGTLSSGSAFYKSDLYKACKQVVLSGYPLGIGAIYSVFHETFFKFVREVSRRYGVTDEGSPSRYDVIQEVFLELHKYFGRGLTIEAPLHVYIAKSVINTCKRLKKAEQKHACPPDRDEILNICPSDITVPPLVAETWEHFDHRLTNSKRGDLINRIILAHLILEGVRTDSNRMTKLMMADWQTLLQMPAKEVETLHHRMTDEARCPSSKGVIWLVADMINANLGEAHQVAILLAAGTGLNPHQTLELLQRLAGFPDRKIHTRVYQIRRVLRPPDRGKE